MKKVLIIDDEDDVRAFVSLMLAAQGAEVREASGGPEGIHVADEFRPDIVVMDYMMPEMTGADAAALLKRILPSVWIVGFSGFDQSFGWADQQVSKGPNAYEELTAAIRAA
jgi:CheY-like chemotaxis protein